MHPGSFTAQKKFLLNDLRRQYLLKAAESPATEQPVAPPASGAPAEPKPAKPVIKRPAAVIGKTLSD